MKVTAFDYILSSMSMSFLWLISGVISFKVIPFFLYFYTKAYTHIIAVVCFLTIYGLLSALLIKVLITVKPLRQGTFDMDHGNFTYWKLLKMITEFGTFTLFILKPDPFKPILYKLFGCKIGRNVAIAGIVDTPFGYRSN